METPENKSLKISRLLQIQSSTKLKQKEFAERIGLTQSKMSLITNGKAGANILNDIFYRLNYEFGVSKEWWDNGTGMMFGNTQISESVAVKSEIDYITTESASYWKGRYDQLKEDYELLLKEIKTVSSASA